MADRARPTGSSPPPTRTLRSRWSAQTDDYVQALVWSPDGSLLASAEVSGPIVLFDGRDGAIRHRLEGHGFGTADLAWSPGGSLLASAGQDGTARIWEADSGRLRGEVRAGATWVERVAWRPIGSDDEAIVATSAGRKIRLWSPDGGELRIYPDQPGVVTDLRWSPDGRTLASAGNGRVVFWSSESEEPTQIIKQPGCPILAIAWSPEGDRLAAGCQDATVHYWTLRDQEHFQMSGYPMKVRRLAFDPSGRWLATDGSAGVAIWDTSGDGPAGTAPVMPVGHDGPIIALGFDPKHPNALASIGEIDRLVILWQLDHPRSFQSGADLGSPGAALAWQADASVFAAGTESGLIAVFEVN